MTKAKISEYDPSAANNTDVNGVNIAEGCAPSGINNAIREVMAAVKRFQTGSDGDSVTVGGNLVVSGTSNLNGTSIPASKTLVDTDSSQTLTNKTISGANNTISNINLASQVTGTLPVANGGTGITSFGTGVAAFLGTPSSSNLASAVTDETGSGSLVFGTNPTISGPTISGGSINNTPVGATTPNTGKFTQLDVDNIRVDGNAITSTNTNGNIALTPNGSGEVDISKVDIDSGAIDGTTIGGTTPAAGTFTVVQADYIYAKNLPSVGSFTWDTATSSPAAADTSVGSKVVTSIHAGMRRCVINDSGVVQYYLNPADSTEKEDGTAANLDGTDGQVMVEIPKFYTRREVSGTRIKWSISAVPLPGFTLHPAFTKNGVEVNFRYYGAYDACYLDATDSTYKSGLNLDDLTASLDLANDKLSSVSGVYPIVGVTRAECRSLAANRGTGWRQLDWALFAAVQLLYLIENQSFYSQNITGAGNTNGSYLSSSANQNDSPHTVAGASNSLGNSSTDTTSGAGVSAKPGTSFMSYRGIENFYGNCWNWADGCIVNPDGTAAAGQGDWWFTNNSADFSDSARTNMTQIFTGAPTSSQYVSAIAAVDNFFIATSVSGGSSSTYLTDYYYGSTSADRVVRVGGSAGDGAFAGAFLVAASNDSSIAIRSVGARLAF